MTWPLGAMQKFSYLLAYIGAQVDIGQVHPWIGLGWCRLQILFIFFIKYLLDAESVRIFMHSTIITSHHNFIYLLHTSPVFAALLTILSVFYVTKLTCIEYLCVTRILLT